MKIEIEIDDQTAACIWANRTWEGREKYTIAEIVKDLAEEEATNYRRHFPQAVARITAAFREPNTKVCHGQSPLA